MARNKQSFQSTFVRSPHFANDDSIGIQVSRFLDYTNENIVYLLLFEKHPNCSKTKAFEKSWWSVDIEKIYRITEVCLLNVNDNLECL